MLGHEREPDFRRAGTEHGARRPATRRTSSPTPGGALSRLDREESS